jgi:gliding motility-associated-like protein
MIDSVKIIGRPKAKINNAAASLCVPAEIGFSNGSSSELPMTFNWTFSNGQTSQEYEPVIIFNSAGIQSAYLMVTTTSPCIDTSYASVTTITVSPAPVADYSVNPTLTTIFDPEITFTDASSLDVVAQYYFFADGTSSADESTIHTYLNHGTYMTSQVVVNQFGCSDTAYKEIKILPEFRFWIPNTFTPNKDGRNDIFMPSCIGVLDYHFYVYDKWGQKIYSTTDHLQGWDGNFLGQKCEQDLYIWKITFTNEVSMGAEDHFGQVLLLRADE